MVTPENETARIERVHVGTMGWSYAFWVGNFYPEGLKPKEFLAEYSKHFNSVELDNTFYRIPSTSTVKAWKQQTPEGFLFSAKFPRLITHIKTLQNCEKDVERFLSSISQLQNRLGPLLLQFPSSFSLNHLPLLKDFLPSLPRGYSYAVEVRNKNLMGEKLYSILRENDVALVLVAQPNFPSIKTVTANFIYIRWEGDRRKVSGTLGRIEVDRKEEIKESAHQTKEFQDRQMEVFGYFSKYYSGHPPNDAEQFLNLLMQ